MAQTGANADPSHDFIGYRREVAEHAPGRFPGRLREVFAREPLFRDVASIDVGGDGIEPLPQGLNACETVPAGVRHDWRQAAHAATTGDAPGCLRDRVVARLR